MPPMISPERREEIIGGIVRTLARVHAGPVDASALDIEVRKHIALLEDVSPKFFARASIQATRKDAEKIGRTIITLQNQIRNATPELRLRMKLDLPNDREKELISWLDELRSLCQTGVDRTDQVIRNCVSTAFTFMVWCTAKVPTSGSARSPFREIASDLYEIITGEADCDLKRPCDDMIRPWRDLTPIEPT
jgi:hypothetical protein